MCLYIDREMHPDGKPLIAGYDMLVWKWLDVNGRSPFRESQWRIGKERSATLRGDRYGDIGPGLHAYLRARGADEVYQAYAGVAVRVLSHPAIVPRGAKFFVGSFGEIVANRMTVYRTLEDALQGRTLGQADFSAHKAAP